MQVHGTFFWLLVPWSEVPDHLVEEMVKYLKAMFRGNQDPAKEPSTHLVKQRIKRYPTKTIPKSEKSAHDGKIFKGEARW